MLDPILIDGYDSESGNAMVGLHKDVLEPILEVMRKRQVPLRFAKAAALSALSAAIGSNLEIHAANYINKPNLWVMLVAPSGSNKSQPAHDLLNPLLQIDAKLTEDYQREYDDKFSQHIASGKKRDTFIAPAPKQLVLSDSTPEARFESLSNNPHGLLLYRDELAAFIEDLNRYNSSGEVADLLTVFDSRMIKCNRKTSGMVAIKEPFLTIYGGIQPGIATTLFANPKFLNNGFLSRFMVYFPDSEGTGSYEKCGKPDWSVMERWERLIKKLYDLPKVCAMMDSEAEKHYARFYNLTRKKQQQLGEEYTPYSEYMQSVLSKARIYALKLAGIMATARYVADGIPLEPFAIIRGDEMLWATQEVMGSVYDHDKMYRLVSAEQKTPLKRKDLFQKLKEFYPDLCISSLGEALNTPSSNLYRYFGNIPA